MEKEMIFDVAIVGAGASGLMCARECARRGLRVVLVEKEPQPARKILASGNGRCNLTNAFVSAADYRGTPQLAAAVLAKFPFEKCLSFFHSLGVLTRQEEAGRIFPLSGKSTAVADALRLACEEAGVQLYTGQEVTRIQKKSHFILTLVNGACVTAQKCVLACGSKAYPQIGGTEAGYKLAKSLGHHITTPTQALCALNVKEKAVARLQGIRLQARVRVPKISDDLCGQGELLFTAYGLSGPAAQYVSGPIGKFLPQGPLQVEIDILPEVENKLEFLKKRVAQFPNRGAKAFFAGMLHENIANLLIDFTGLRKNAPVSSWTENTQRAVANTLHAWPFTVLSLRPWSEAMVAAGGVNCAEINYNTMESLQCPGLYIVGELLDVDGRSGGFNLHFAWACGYVAAAALAEE